MAMSEPRGFASLTSGLLARKGGARPAMRRPDMGGNQDDLGWNDMGHEPVRPLPALGLTPLGADAARAVAAPVPAVVEQQQRLAETMAAEPVTETAVPEAAPVELSIPVADIEAAAVAIAPRKGKAAFTLRLDPERHLKLRLACAVGHISAQQLVTQALDAFLNQHVDVSDLAEQIARTRMPKDA